MWSCKVHRHLLPSTGRNICYSAAVSNNHYDVLGITPNATQAEVKAAYYKLSKLHHPDTSTQEDEDGDKFRLITEAYDVLGNYRSRQLYDKGLYGHFKPTERKKDVTPDHPKMSFYQSRFTKEHVPSSRMSKGIYDFDEWTRQHYSESFAKTSEGIKSRRKTMNEDPREVATSDLYLKLSLIALFLTAFGFSSLGLSNQANDSPRPFSDTIDKP